MPQVPAEGGLPWLLSETLQRRVRGVRSARRCLLAAYRFRAYLTHDVTLLTKPDGSPQPPDGARAPVTSAPSTAALNRCSWASWRSGSPAPREPASDTALPRVPQEGWASSPFG